MRPATEPTVAFSESNAFALALAGLEATLHRVDQALTQATPPEGSINEVSRAVDEHPLDLALLGLISLARRLEALGQTGPGVSPGVGVPSSWDPEQDMLR